MSDDSNATVKIMQLIKRRKNYLNIIEHSLSNGDAFFAKCFRLSDNIEETLHKDPAQSNITARNYFLLGSFLSNTIFLQNSQRKLALIARICEQYQILSSQKLPYNARFQIAQLPRLALNPPRADLAICIIETTSAMDIQKDFVKMARTVSLPEELNLQTVLESLCNVLSLTYNMFVDSLYANQESLETILKIDGMLYEQFFQPILQIYFEASDQLLEEEFQKINEIIFDEDKHLQHTSMSSLIAQFDADLSS